MIFKKKLYNIGWLKKELQKLDEATEKLSNIDETRNDYDLITPVILAKRLQLYEEFFGVKKQQVKLKY